MMPAFMATMPDAGRHHPEEQGLKPATKPMRYSSKQAGRHHPEEQGLKHIIISYDKVIPAAPVGIIQKNKD